MSDTRPQDPSSQFDPEEINACQAKLMGDATMALLQAGMSCRIYKHGCNWVIIPGREIQS